MSSCWSFLRPGGKSAELSSDRAYRVKKDAEEYLLAGISYGKHGTRDKQGLQFNNQIYDPFCSLYAESIWLYS